MDEKDFRQMVLAEVPAGAEFKPAATYDPDGDCIEFLASNENYYAERIDSLVTVYYSEETNEIVGSLIKGAKKFIQGVLERVPGFKIEIQDGRIKLEHIFTAKMWAATDDELPRVKVITYRKLRAVAEKAGVEADVNLAAAI